MHAWRGIVVTMAGSVFSVGGAIIAQATSHIQALVGQVETPSPSALGAAGVVIGLGGVVTGLVVQVYDRANARYKAQLEFRLRRYQALQGVDSLCEYAKATYAYSCRLRSLVDKADIPLPPDMPPDPGPPPRPPMCRRRPTNHEFEPNPNVDAA